MNRLASPDNLRSKINSKTIDAASVQIVGGCQSFTFVPAAFDREDDAS